MSANIEESAAKPIMLRPSPELRKVLEEEAASRRRSLNNLIIVLLERIFRTKLNSAR